MKFSKSKLDTTYWLSTKAKVCLERTLPNSLSLVVDDILLNSFTAALEILSSRVTFLLTSLVVKMVDVNTPRRSPFEF